MLKSKHEREGAVGDRACEDFTEASSDTNTPVTTPGRSTKPYNLEHHLCVPRVNGTSKPTTGVLPPDERQRRVDHAASTSAYKLPQWRCKKNQSYKSPHRNRHRLTGTAVACQRFN